MLPPGPSSISPRSSVPSSSAVSTRASTSQQSTTAVNHTATESQGDEDVIHQPDLASVSASPMNSSQQEVLEMTIDEFMTAAEDNSNNTKDSQVHLNCHLQTIQ